jgi:hypothetical protein
MPRAIQRISEADKEWKVWKEELARRHDLQEKQKEYDLWKQFMRGNSQFSYKQVRAGMALAQPFPSSVVQQG